MKKKELKGLQCNRVLIPESIITDTTLQKYRVATLAYICAMTGVAYQINFSIKLIVNWLGKSDDRHITKHGCNTASGVKDCIESFKESGILSYDNDELRFATLIEGQFDKEKYSEYYAHERFAKIYIDELTTIINYKNSNNDGYIDNSILLLVFAYLRMKIPVKNNLAGAGERADAYDTNYNVIGNELGLSERLVSRAIRVLVQLGFLYEQRRGVETYYSTDEKGNRIVHRKEKTIIFCNAYKRIDKGSKTYLEAEGEDYYLKEASDKENELERKRL